MCSGREISLMLYYCHNPSPKSDQKRGPNPDPNVNSNADDFNDKDKLIEVRKSGTLI